MLARGHLVLFAAQLLKLLILRSVLQGESALIGHVLLQRFTGLLR